MKNKKLEKALTSFKNTIAEYLEKLSESIESQIQEKYPQFTNLSLDPEVFYEHKSETFELIMNYKLKKYSNKQQKIVQESGYVALNISDYKEDADHIVAVIYETMTFNRY